jgi:hypothetical protein
MRDPHDEEHHKKHLRLTTTTTVVAFGSAATATTMFVVKRSGKRESVHFDKITSRVSKLCYGLDSKVSSSPRGCGAGGVRV